MNLLSCNCCGAPPVESHWIEKGVMVVAMTCSNIYCRKKPYVVIRPGQSAADRWNQVMVGCRLAEESPPVEKEAQ